ncbi:Ig-like domain-containing protein (plasmid) [Klebsiella pneumoniae]|nr:Ig-like domain-containing protein [Klebsiella pneumoniae]
MPEQKMKITEEAFADFTGHMCRAGFTNSISDQPLSERQQNRITAATATVRWSPVVAVTGVSVDPSTTSVEANKTVQLTANIEPAGATNKRVTWASKNAEFATVDSATGLVTGVAAGTATIEVTTEDGSHKATATVEVTAAPAASPTLGGDAAH